MCWDVTLDADYLAVLKLSILNDIVIPDDTSIYITHDGILGSKYVKIRPGNSDDALRKGEFIYHTHPSPSFSLDSIIQNFLGNAR